MVDLLSPIFTDSHIKKYWKLQEMIPKNERPIEFQFEARLEFHWRCYSGFIDMPDGKWNSLNIFRSSEWFEVEVNNCLLRSKLRVWAGIARKSGKEIVVSNAEIVHPLKSRAHFRLIQRSELQKIMNRYKELQLFVAIEDKSEEKILKEEEKKKFYMLMQKFRTDYKELLLSGRHSDFTINVKPVKFEVHKSILGARSPVFSAMMEHDMEEKRSGEVSLIDSDPAVFKEFLLYLYTGEEEHLDWKKNIAELYALADKYCVEDLKYLCVERMKTHISIENFFPIFYISQQLNNLELSEIVIQFFLEDSDEIVAGEKYIEFMKEHPEETSVLVKALETDDHPEETSVLVKALETDDHPEETQ